LRRVRRERERARSVFFFLNYEEEESERGKRDALSFLSRAINNKKTFWKNKRIQIFDLSLSLSLSSERKREGESKNTKNEAENDEKRRNAPRRRLASRPRRICFRTTRRR
jgi:hypothetical protein